MKTAPALALASLVLLSTFAAAEAPNPAVADAQKKLDTARANLAKAMEAANKDAPNVADLDAAFAAAEALKAAVDAGAANEAKDLDYAKSVLAARKEVRSARELVDERRAKVHMFDARRTLDAALATLKERAKQIEDKDAGTKDFEDMRAAMTEVKKVADGARQFAKSDAKFASFLGEVDATLARSEKAFDERGLKLLLDKQRPLIDDGRKALASAVGALGKEATDAQFKAADIAVTVLTKRLEEGKSLEAKDKAYRADTDKARAELAAAKKKMDESFSEAGVARLKAELEPAHKDLQAALKSVRARKPTDDQLAEAKTTAIVVRKLVEKFQPEAARSQAFGVYVNEVKKTLVDVEVELNRRSLDGARAGVVAALKGLEKRDPPEDAFGEATTAVTVLEKSLEAVPKAPEMAQPVADAKTLIKDAKATMAKRRFEIEVLHQRAKVDEAKKQANEAVKQIQQGKPEPALMQAAEAGVKALKAALDEGAALVKKDGEYRAFDAEVKKRITELTERIAARKQALVAGDGRAALTNALAEAKAKLEATKQAASGDADLDATVKAVEAVGKLLEAQAPLAKQDKGYAAQAERAGEAFYNLTEQAELAKLARALRRQTSEALVAGAKLVDGATGDLRSRKAAYEKAIAEFKSCDAEGGRMVRQVAPLAKVAVLLDGQPSTPAAVTAQCAQRATATEALVKEVVPLIAFDDGPRKAFEAAKGLLAKGDKAAALAQFDECVATGVILGNRSPEIKERKFDVAGASLALPEVVAQCSAERKALRGK